MQWMQVAREDVKAFAAGYAADGATPLPKSVSFPWRPDRMTSVALLASTMYLFVDVTWPRLLQDPALRTAIMFKLVAHLPRVGAVQPDSIRDLIQDAAMAATTLAEYPHLIGEPVNFAALVRRYRQFLDRCKREKEANARKTITRPSSAPPRVTLSTFAAGKFHLSELSHPWHLVEESLALGHCVGMLLSATLPRHEHELTDLPYWKYITCGQSRVFSLGDNDGRPICTINVDLGACELTQLQGRSRDVPLSQDYYPALVEAVAFLKTLLPGLTVARDFPALALLDRPSGAPITERAQAQQLGQALRDRGRRYRLL